MAAVQEVYESGQCIMTKWPHQQSIVHVTPIKSLIYNCKSTQHVQTAEREDLNRQNEVGGNQVVVKSQPL